MKQKKHLGGRVRALSPRIEPLWFQILFQHLRSRRPHCGDIELAIHILQLRFESVADLLDALDVVFVRLVYTWAVVVPVHRI